MRYVIFILIAAFAFSLVMGGGIRTAKAGASKELVFAPEKKDDKSPKDESDAEKRRRKMDEVLEKMKGQTRKPVIKKETPKPKPEPKPKPKEEFGEEEFGEEEFGEEEFGEEEFGEQDLPEPAPEQKKPEKQKDLKTWSKRRNMFFHVEEAYMQKAGTYQLITDLSFTRGPYMDRLRSTNDFNFRANRLTAKFVGAYGYSDNIELNFSGPLVLSHEIHVNGGTLVDSDTDDFSGSGLGDFLVGGRYLVMKESKTDWYLPTFSIGAGLSLPVGSDDVTVYGTGVGGYISFHASREFEDLAVNLFLKETFLPGSTFGDDEVTITEQEVGLGLTLFSEDDLNVLFELFGENENAGPNGQGRKTTHYYIAPGFELNLTEDSALGFSVFRSISTDGYDYGIGLRYQTSF